MGNNFSVFKFIFGGFVIQISELLLSIIAIIIGKVKHMVNTKLLRLLFDWSYNKNDNRISNLM